jgi:hypothetical protein
MAYNTSIGKRDLGDIEYEGDPDTQIDFGNNRIKFKTNAKVQMGLYGSAFYCSSSLTASTTITAPGLHNTAGDLRVATSGSNGGHLRLTAYLNSNSDNNIYLRMSTTTGGTGVKFQNEQLAEVASINSKGILSASSEVSASAFRGSAMRVTFPITTVTTVYTASVRDYTILANTQTRNITVLLPTAAIASQKIYNIKKISSLNTLTITSSNGTIDGVASQEIEDIYTSYTLHSNGTNWFII